MYEKTYWNGIYRSGIAAGLLACLGTIAACSSDTNNGGSGTGGTAGAGTGGTAGARTGGTAGTGMGGTAGTGTGGTAGAGGAGGTSGPTDGGTDGSDTRGDGSTDVPPPIVLGTATRIDPKTNMFYSLEGPLWVPGAAGAEGYLLFSDVVEADGPTAKIWKYVPSTMTYTALNYPGPTSTNGLAMDSMGRLIVTERYKARVTRFTLTGTTAMPLVTMVDGMMTLNAPNDVIVGPMDNIYFTDTLWGSKKREVPMQTLGPNSVYRVAPNGTVTRIHMSTSTNGIALSPDNKILYVGNDMENKVWKFTVNTDGSVAPGAPVDFLTKASVPGDQFIIPDGINVDDLGNVYVALNDNAVNAVAVFSPAGAYMGQYNVPVPLDAGKTNTGGQGPSNITFGGADRKTLYITTHHAIWQVAVPTAGKP